MSALKSATVVLILGTFIPTLGMAAQYGSDVDRSTPWNEQSCYRIGSEV